MDRNCDICQKNKATIHLQQVMGNKEVNLHICDDCAFENGISRDDDKIEVSLTGLFAGIMDVNGDFQRKKNKTCPSCSMHLKDFNKELKPGCPMCFEIFAKEIHAFYEDQGVISTYNGPLPRKLMLFKNLYEKRERLAEDLEKAVTNEEYEKAAEIRDKLKELDRDPK